MEGAEDCFPVCDRGYFICFVEFIDSEVEIGVSSPHRVSSPRVSKGLWNGDEALTYVRATDTMHRVAM